MGIMCRIIYLGDYDSYSLLGDLKANSTLESLGLLVVPPLELAYLGSFVLDLDALV